HNLAIALDKVGRPDEAIAAYREALRLNKDDFKGYNSLGWALHRRGQLDEAIAAFEKAIRIAPDYALAHCHLGLTLQRRGRIAEALASLRRGHELGRKDPRWIYPSATYLKICERMLELDHRLAAILAGTDELTDQERPAFAELCLYR